MDYKEVDDKYYLNGHEFATVREMAGYATHLRDALSDIVTSIEAFKGAGDDYKMQEKRYAAIQEIARKALG